MGEKHYYGKCPRCGVAAKDRRHPLCMDCRDTMSEAETDGWLDDDEEQEAA